MKALQYFVGKICTVLTGPLNRDFKEENPETYRQQVYQYFLGRVLEVDNNGILMEQILTPERLKSYFNFNNIVGLCEEQSIEANTEENENILNAIQTHHENTQKELEKDMQASPTQDGPIVLGEFTPEGEFINTDAMADVAKQMKEKFGK